ncbi:unnamed protein product [Rhizoctonia solani]|uniref:Transcription factor spt8 beta-propeller domain-containing protein n=1 Tax=Rhizoctonia solani TaxID=456999 RepID=A0A8H2X290_9AGAM|nr:unnamed protein product [Rhizoctonia solani]
MQALNYEDEEMEFEGSSPFNADDDDDEADTQSENSEPEEEPDPEPEPGESGDESDQAEDSDQEHASSPPSEHEPEETKVNVFEKRRSPVMVPVIPPVVPVRAASPAALRRAAFITEISSSNRSYSIDPICAYPHPVPTHSLAASKCMTHLLTGSDDGYIRDYDFYAGCNGKVLLTAPQRQHCGLGEGVMKGGVLRMWWENPSGEDGSQSSGDMTPAPSNVLEGGPPSPVYCMTLHSDALWGLSGTAAGNINLFTVRHEPGRVHFVLRGHKGPTSGLALSADEKKVYSAGWDGHALEWDLNVGQIVRRYPSHGAQLVSIGIRPISSNATDSSSPSVIPSTLPHNPPENFINSTNGAGGTMGSQKVPTQMGGSPRSAEEDYDPLFDDPELDASADLDHGAGGGRGASSALAWRSAVPALDPGTYEHYSHNILMTAAIDGQITIWDRRVAGSTPGSGVGRLEIPEKTPPWCVSACWSADGSQLYAGRRNGIVEVWDMRQTRNTHEGTPRLLRTLRNPLSSGAVSCVVAFPDGKHLACASQDNIRLWNVSAEAQAEATSRSRVAPFKIIAGHHGGTISQIPARVPLDWLPDGKPTLVGSALTADWHTHYSSVAQLTGYQSFLPTPLLVMAAVAYHHRPAPVPTAPPHMHPSEMDMDPRPPSPTSSTSTVTSSRTPDFFRQLHDRQLNCMNTTYMLPADEQEMKRMDIEHRMMKFIMGGKNYIGPVADALTKVPGIQRRVLDCGTGNGLWAIEMADEFDWVEVTGVDLAPIQPRSLQTACKLPFDLNPSCPPYYDIYSIKSIIRSSTNLFLLSCSFELFDLDGQRLPYPDSWFDVVHARSVYTGVRHYSIFLRELARVLRPGGVAIFAEVDSTPVGEKKNRIPLEPRGGAPGWAQYWDQVRRALGQLGIDVSIPSQLRSRVRDTRQFEHIVAQEAMVPIGFWPKDPVVLSIGQLAWMNYDNLLLALRPLLLDHGITPDKAAKLIEDAQENLYHPKAQPYCCWHIVHARKTR